MRVAKGIRESGMLSIVVKWIRLRKDPAVDIQSYLSLTFQHQGLGSKIHRLPHTPPPRSLAAESQLQLRSMLTSDQQTPHLVLILSVFLCLLAVENTRKSLESWLAPNLLEERRPKSLMQTFFVPVAKQPSASSFDLCDPLFAHRPVLSMPRSLSRNRDPLLYVYWALAISGKHLSTVGDFSITCHTQAPLASCLPISRLSGRKCVIACISLQINMFALQTRISCPVFIF